MKKGTIIAGEVIFIALIATVAATLFFIQKQRLTATFEEQVESQSLYIASTLSHPLSQSNTEEMQKILSFNIKEKSSNHTAIVSNAEGTLVAAETKNSNVSKENMLSKRNICNTCDYVTTPILYNDVPIGQLDLFAEKTGLHAQVKRAALTLLIISIIAIIAGNVVAVAWTIKDKNENQLEEKTQVLEIISKELTQKTKELQEKTRELERRNHELEETTNLMIGRELKMTELKKRVAELESTRT